MRNPSASVRETKFANTFIDKLFTLASEEAQITPIRRRLVITTVQHHRSISRDISNTLSTCTNKRLHMILLHTLGPATQRHLMASKPKGFSNCVAVLK